MATTPVLSFSFEVEMPLRRIADLLCSALEGGSNYWYQIESVIEPPAGYVFRSDPNAIFRHLDAPLNTGGALIIASIEGDEHRGLKSWRLSRLTIRRGLRVMAEKYPQHYAAFVAENDDASTGDVFLQCCLFEEVIYG